jgi:hypothetical protein
MVDLAGDDSHLSYMRVCAPWILVQSPAMLCISCPAPAVFLEEARFCLPFRLALM